jgi:hypothetical protein
VQGLPEAFSDFQHVMEGSTGALSCFQTLLKALRRFFSFSSSPDNKGRIILDVSNKQDHLGVKKWRCHLSNLSRWGGGEGFVCGRLCGRFIAREYKKNVPLWQTVSTSF